MRRLIQTHSFYLVQDADGQAEVVRRIDELVSTHPDLVGRESFVLPYVTSCWRAYRPMTAAGRSFDETAPTYAAVRPAYPLDALAWLVPDGADRVLDLGAGTGKLTRQLVDAGYDVVAVEPSPQLGAELSAYVPAAELRMGTAEDIPLPDAEVEAVLVGSAFHWFDHDAALAEITRVLRPGAARAGPEPAGRPAAVGGRTGWDHRRALTAREATADADGGSHLRRHRTGGLPPRVRGDT
ncbi:MAG: class I SAM-dependent methyltransferase [Geodermatophilaceae bacterium]